MSKAKILCLLFLIIIGWLQPKSIAESIFVEFDLSGKEAYTAIYPGQELTLTVSLHTPTRMRTRIKNPPRIEFDNATPADFTDIKTPFPDFHSYDKEYRQINNENYRIYRFSTIFSPIAPGTSTGVGEFSVSVKEKEEQPPIHYRFNNTVGDWLRPRNRVERDQKFTLPDLPVAPLPAPPAGGQFTGLVGDWRIQATLSENRLQIQTPVELVFEAIGKGRPDKFQAPELLMPGFLIKGPEISYRRLDKRISRITARWIIIPQLPSIKLPELQWTSFSPRTETYIEHNFRLNPILVPVSPPEKEETFSSPAPSLGAKLPLTWWQRHLWLLIIAGLLSLTIILGVADNTLRSTAAIRDEIELRRRRTIKKGATISHQLRNCDQSQLAIIMKTQVVPWLIELLQMPPGTTPEGLAEALKNIDPELAAMIEITDHLQFAPELQTQLNGKKLARSLAWISQRKKTD